MKFGVREICDVVLKAKTAQKIGNKIFYAGEPVCYFDTLKTSSLEGAATTVYAQGGRGNARLMAWEGERTVTFTMEDALISPEGFMILSGAGLIDASASKPVYQHVTETVDGNDVKVADDGTMTIPLSKMPYLPEDRNDNYAYVMLMYKGEIVSEPYIPKHVEGQENENGTIVRYVIEPNADGKYEITVPTSHENYVTATTDTYAHDSFKDTTGADIIFDSVMVDFYVAHESDAQQIEITADKFGGNYYLEASTLFRDTNGVDMPAEFIIPNCKVQSNFTFTMASSGDPSSFTFTMDAFPDYTRFDKSKKVLAAIQIIKEGGSQEIYRTHTVHAADHDKKFN